MTANNPLEQLRTMIRFTENRLRKKHPDSSLLMPRVPEDMENLDRQIHHFASLRADLEDPLFKKTAAGMGETVGDPLEIERKLKIRMSEKLIGKMINYDIQVRLTQLRYVDGVNINAYYIIRRQINRGTLKITFQPVFLKE